MGQVTTRCDCGCCRGYSRRYDEKYRDYGSQRFFFCVMDICAICTHMARGASHSCLQCGDEGAEGRSIALQWMSSIAERNVSCFQTSRSLCEFPPNVRGTVASVGCISGQQGSVWRKHQYEALGIVRTIILQYVSDSCATSPLLPQRNAIVCTFLRST